MQPPRKWMPLQLQSLAQTSALERMWAGWTALGSCWVLIAPESASCDGAVEDLVPEAPLVLHKPDSNIAAERTASGALNPSLRPVAALIVCSRPTAARS